MKHVVFDTAGALFFPGGISTYIRNLQVALAQLSTAYGVTVHNSDLPTWLAAGRGQGLRHKAVVAGWDTYYTQFVLPARAHSIHADLIHATGIRLPIKSDAPVISTVYDAIPLLYPELFRFRDRMILRFYLQLTKACTKHIITISEQSRQDIHRLLNVPLNQITVTYIGPNQAIRPASEAQIHEVLQRLGIQQPYILCVGNVEPRKNLLRILESFTQLRAKYGYPHNLVIVGKHIAALNHPMYAAVEQLSTAAAITFTGFVKDADLAALYSGAAFFIYPSLYEGFGIPPLEAMRCGCPVIVSSTSSLPEVVGVAALKVNPLSVPEIVEAMAQLVEDHALRERLRLDGLVQADKFTWQNCARDTVNVYHKVMSSSQQALI